MLTKYLTPSLEQIEKYKRLQSKGFSVDMMVKTGNFKTDEVFVLKNMLGKQTTSWRSKGYFNSQSYSDKIKH